MQFFIKVLISALLIAGVSELGKRYTPIAAILASLPLTSILAFIWLYRETASTEKVVELSYGIFWMVIPSLLFFIILPLLLKKGLAFGWSMLLTSAVIAVFYWLFVFVLGKFGVKL